MLTGKARENFESWYLKFKSHYDKLTILDTGKINQMYNLDHSCIYAIIIEWLDSVGLHVSVEPHLGGGAEVFYSKVFYRHPENFVDTWDDVENKGYVPKIYYFSDRQSATKAAIEQANKIYNER